MATQIKLRRDTAQNWTTSNPVLALGEPGIETDTYKFKFGDGQTAWANLAYYGSDFATTTFVNNAISNVVGAAPDLLNTLQELSSAINIDPSFFSTINNQLANKANVADIPNLNGYATESFVTNAIGQISGSDWANIADKPTFSTVATSGSYNDLADLPSYSVVATTGSYNDLSDKPSIPSITGLATESFVSNAIANVVNSAPALLDTLNELANAIGNDSSFTTTITNQLANKANVSDIPSLSGYATETYVTSQGYITSSALTYGNISGTPTLSTVATSGDYNDLSNKPSIPSLTGYATETYVNNAISSASGLGGGSGNSISEGSHTLQVNTDGSVTFPDGTIQTTAYITPQQYGYINQFIHSTTQNVDMEAVAMDSGGNSYVSYSYYDDNENRRFGGIIKLNSTGSVEWNKNLQSSNTNGQYPQIASLEHVNIQGTNFLVAIGYYYDNNASKDRGFMWLINPTDGSVGSMFDTETSGDVPVVLHDAVFGLDASSQPFAVVVGHTYNETLQKSFTPLAGSGLNKLVVSWSEYNASNIQPGENIYYTVGGNYQIRLNYFEVGAAPVGQSDGLYIAVSINQDGTYNIIRTNGWSGTVYSWGNPVNVRVLGSRLGGVDGVNDLTFDFNPNGLNNSNNVAGWASNIQGTAISEVVGLGWGDKDWSTEIGNTLSFNYQLNQQAYIARLGANSWGKSVGDAEYERLNTVVVDSNGNSYAGAYYWNGNKASLVVKYDIDGNQQWAVYIDSPNDTGNAVMSIDLLSDGNLITVDEGGVVTKINSSNGNIIWQVKVDPNDDISWDSDFKGTATPNGNYIFTNYEDNDYTLYVMCVSGTDGSEVWSKRITRNFGGSNGEIYPQDDYEAQCIDCNDTSVTIAASTYLYFNNNSTYAGLVINFPIDGENTNGVYGQYIIESVSPGWNTETTTATSATVNAVSSPVILGPTGPTVSTNTFTMTENIIGASAGPNLGNITFDGSKLSSPAPNSGDFPNGVITLAPGDASETAYADYGQFINIYPTTAFDAPHIHIAAGNGINGNGSLILGNDNYHIDVNNNGNIYIKTNNQNHTWTFDNNGNLTLPYGGGINDSSGVSIVPAAQIQSDWTQTDNTLKDYIKNKPTIPTDLDSLTDVTITTPTSGQVLKYNGTTWVNDTDSSGGGGTTLPADASGYLNNNGSGTLTWVAGNPAGSGLLPYTDVKVFSATTVADWTEYTLSGTMDALFDYNNSFSPITLSNEVVYGKQSVPNTKILNISDTGINSNRYGIVVEFPSNPAVGDVISVLLQSDYVDVNAGSFVIGETYTIKTLGTTTWTSIGASFSGVGQTFVATGIGSGTGVAYTTSGVKKLIFKPASGQRVRTMQAGSNSTPFYFGQGGSYDMVYLDAMSQSAGNPITWVYAGVIGGIPTWYQTYF